VPSTLVDEECWSPKWQPTTGVQTTNQVHMAYQYSDPTHAVTGQGQDGRAAGSSLESTVAPRATCGRDTSVEGVTGTATTDQRGR
jgi:hypothetical protein